MENKMNIADEELAKAKRLSDIGALAATVAHELRNPLAAINIAMQNIRRKKQDLPIDKHLDSIEKKILESDQIISNFLFCLRLKIPDYEVVNISSILDECIDSIKKRDNKREFEILREIGNRNVLIEADPLQMRELFNYILNNAFDAIATKKGNITVGLEINGIASVVIYFKDNGVGIPVEVLQKIQEPFSTIKAKGTVLGLSACQQIVMLHNGEFDIKSELGQGTTVTICLPSRR
jgi:signal transduction histidine kinase